VDIFTALHSSTGSVRRIKDLIGEALRHRGFTTLPCKVNEPTYGQCLCAARPYLNRNLIGRTTNTTRADLESRTHVVDGAFEDGKGLGACALLNDVHCGVHNASSGTLLALEEDLVRDLGHQYRLVDRVWIELANFCWSSTHLGILLRTVLGTSLFAAFNASGVKRSTDNFVTDTRKVLHTSATDEDDRVFLKVVALSGDVGGYLRSR
jgi:hypothetical protein